MKRALAVVWALVLVAACVHAKGPTQERGAIAPPLSLASASGETVSSEGHRGQDKLVVVFFRGHW